MAEEFKPLVGTDLNQSFADALSNFSSPLNTQTDNINYGSSLADKKKQDILGKTATKKAVMDSSSLANLSPMELAAGYANATDNNNSTALNAINSELAQRNRFNQLQNLQRTNGEIVTDTAGSLLKGIGNLTSGAIQAGIENNPVTTVGKLFNDASQASRLVDDNSSANAFANIGTFLRNPTNKVRTAVANTSKDFQDYLSPKMSEPTQRDILTSDTAQNLDEEANKAKAIADGNSKWDKAKRVGRDFTAGVSNLLNNPLAAEDLVVQQLPQLATGFTSKAAAANRIGDSVASNIIENAAAKAEAAVLKRGGSAADVEKAVTSATDKIKDYAAKQNTKAIDELAEKNQVFNTGFQEGAGAIDQATQQVNGMSHEQLMNGSTAYADYIKNNGDTPANREAAKNAAATSAGDIAGLIQAPLAMATGKITSKFEVNPFTHKANNTASKLLETFRNTGKEVIEEIPQSASGQLAGNVGVQLAADKNQDLLEGVGNSAAQGFIGAVGMTGAAQAPGSISAIGKDALSGVKSVTKGINNTVEDVAKARTENNKDNVEAAKDIDKNKAEVNDAIDTLDKTAPVNTTEENNEVKSEAENNINGNDSSNSADIPTDTESNTASSVAENIFNPESKQLINELAKSNTSDARQLQQVNEILESSPDMAPEHKRALEIYANDKLGNIINHINENVAPAYEAETDPTIKAQYAKQMQAVNTIVNSDSTKKFLDAYSEDHVSDEEFDNTINSLPKEITKENINTPEVQNAFTKIKEASLYRPLDISPEIYQKVLDHDTSLTPQQTKVIQAKQAAAINFAANNASVSNNIRQQSRDDFKSTQDHVKGIFDAVNNKNVSLAMQRLNKLKNFAEGLVARADAHNKQMQIVRATGNNKDDRYTAVPGYFQLNKDGSKGKGKPQFVQLGKAGEENIEAINNDARHVADVYNKLIAAIPNAPKSELISEPKLDWTKPATQDVVDNFHKENNITVKSEPVITTEDEVSASREDTTTTEDTTQEEPVVDKPVATKQVKKDTKAESTKKVNKPKIDKTVSKEVETTPTVEKEHVGKTLLDSLPEGNKELINAKTIPEKVARTNQLKASFEPVKNNTSNYKLGVLNDITDEDITNTLKVDTSKSIKEGLGTVQKEVRKIASVMNKALAEANTKYKIVEKADTAFPVSALQDRKALFGTQIIDGKIKYIPQIQESLALSGMNWLLSTQPISMDKQNVAKLLNINVNEVTPQQIDAANGGGITVTSASNQIAGMLEKLLGIKQKSSTSRTYGRNITNALARELIRSMDKAGMIKIIPIPMNGKNEVVNTIKILDTPIKKEITDKFSGDTELLKKLLLPKENVHVSIGENNLNVPTKVNGDTWQVIPPAVQSSIKNQQSQPYKVNVPFLNMFEMLLNKTGVSGALAAAGYVETNDAMHSIYKANTDATNSGLVNAMAYAGNLIDTLKVHPEGYDAPIHWAYDMDTNGRTRMSAPYNPQSNKVIRELINATSTQVDMDNPQHMREFNLHIAQGLDIKTDKMSNDEAIKKLGNLLNSDSDIQSAVGAMEKGLLDGWDKVSKTEAQHIVDAVAGKSNKYLHTLLSVAKHNVAMLNGDTSFEHSLTYEVDGVTDGPANAFIHFGMTNINKGVLAILRKVGWNINTPDLPSNMDVDPINNPDIYVTAASNIYSKLKANGSEPAIAIGSLLNYVGMVEMDDENHVTGLSRSFAKLLVTPGTYGSGKYAMAATVGNEFIDNLYKHINDVLIGNDTLNSGMLSNLDILSNSKKFTQLLRMNKSQLQKVDFSKEAVAITDTINNTIADDLYEGIDEALGGALSNIHEMAMLANVQGAVFKSAWEKGYSDLQDKRVKEGKLAPNEMLSQQDEDYLTKSLQHLAPIYQNGITGNNVSNGFNMLTMNPNGANASYLSDSTKTKARTTALDGSLATNTIATEITPPGVRTIALGTIAGGDASMMTRFFNAAKNKNIIAQNVYDGLDTRVGDMEASSDLINQCVAEGWNTNLYKNIIHGVNEVLKDIDLSKLSDESLQSVIQSVTGEKIALNEIPAVRTESTYADLENTINRALQNQKGLASKNTLVRKVLLDTKSTVSHMGGYDKAYNHGSTTYTGTIEQQIDNMQHRVSELSKQIETDTKINTDEAMLKSINKYATTKDSVTTLTGKQFKKFIKKNEFSNKTTGAIINRIGSVISDTATMYYASDADINSLQTSLFPDISFNPLANATTYGNTVFFRTMNEETLLHEVIHLGTQSIINTVVDKTNKVPEQVKAVRNIYGLMNQFMKLTPQNTEFVTSRTIAYAKNNINKYLNQGDTASAMNEFTAWTLANQHLQNFTSTVNAVKGTTAKNAFATIVGKLKSVIAKMLKLPSSRSQSILEALAGNVDNLVKESNTFNSKDISTTDLHTALDHSTNSPVHVTRLDNLVQRLDSATKQIVKQPGELLSQSARVRTLINGSASKINETTKEFQSAGWALSDKEEHAFKLTQVLLASQLQLNPTAMNAAQRLYDSVMPKLTVDMFTGDGELKLKALNSSDKTTQLANFISLGNTSEEFRTVLSKLDIPRKESQTEDLSSKLGNYARTAIDYIADLGNGTRKANNAKQVLDMLSDKISDINYATKNNLLDAPTNLLSRADSYLSGKFQEIGNKAGDKLKERILNGTTATKTDSTINSMLTLVGTLDKDANSSELLQSIVNNKNLWTPVRELFTEMLGSTKSSSDVNRMLQQVKNQVSAVRQKIREGVPKVIQSKFSRELTKEEWSAITNVLGKTDIQSLLFDYGHDGIQKLITNPTELSKAIKSAEQIVSKLPNGSFYKVRAEELAHYMVTGDNISDHLLRNAKAIAEMAGVNNTVEDSGLYIGDIDNLVSLYALDKTSKSDKTQLTKLLKSESNGLKFITNYLSTINKIESSKLELHDSINGYKGMLPTVTSSHKNMVVADAKTGANLVKNYGYVKVPGYISDSDLGKNKLNYYYTNENLTAGYTQGVMQTVEPLIYGVDPLSGQTDSLRGSFNLQRQQAYAMANTKRNKIVNAKLGTTGGKLMPVFNKDGEINKYETPIPHKILNNQLDANTNLSELLAVWQGRQTEETLAQAFNTTLNNKLLKVWDTDKHTSRKSEYIDIVKEAKKSKVVAETWNAVPRSAKEELTTLFGKEPIMVRLDMLNNAFGYRDFSVSQLFTNQTDLPNNVRQGIVNLTTAIMGAKAAKYLRKGERVTQDAVSLAKDWIIVRSMSVFAMNLAGNFIQLGQNGVGIRDIFKGQAAKMQEVDAYMRNVDKMNNLYSDNLGSEDKDRIARNNAAIDRLQQANKRMSIAPLVMAGELPTVAEGLTIADDNSLRGDGFNWMDKLISKLPEGISEKAKIALISKGTPLHTGLNRMITYSDFVAKAVLYDKLLNVDKKTPEEALHIIQEEFINYDNNPGRSRTWLESMGLTWFLTYKLKIQKILLRRMRDNPLSSLVYQGIADGVGIDSPFEAGIEGNNFWYSFGTPLRALGAPAMHPVVKMF